MTEVRRVDKDKIFKKNFNILEVQNELDENNLGDLVEVSFSEVSKMISPLWDVRDYVAVNPFFGLRDRSFLDVANYMSNVVGANLLPKRNYFLKKYEAQEITEYDLEVASTLYQKDSDSSNTKNKVTIQELMTYVNTQNESSLVPTVKCISDLYEHKAGEQVNSLIVNEVSRWASAYFDEGQALWTIDRQGKRLYTWWRSLAVYENPFQKKTHDFLALVKSLPDCPKSALETLTKKLLDKKSRLNDVNLTNYYYRLIYSVLGWSSYIQKFEFEAKRSDDNSKLQEIGGLIDILVMRMTYDVAFLESVDELTFSDELPRNSRDFELGYIWLNALENAYRRKVESSVKQAHQLKKSPERPDVQMAFCIDVRSEILRRHLEKCSQKIETIGFAGFFGMPISLKGLGHQGTDQNCPILLNSAYEIGESGEDQHASLVKKKHDYADNHLFRKSLQGSANSGFSFVETFGLSYIFKMLKVGLRSVKPNIDFTSFGLTDAERKHIKLDVDTLRLEEKVSLAFSALKNMGLTKNFAKYVFFFGHGSESSNNPYASALDCGACAGHNGQGNASLLASLLNDQDVQEELRDKGIEIPEDTTFFSGWHNTVKDELKVDHGVNLNHTQEEELNKYYELFDKASKNCIQERAVHLPGCIDLNDTDLSNELHNKANDWSEIRPEWGLSRNASFIIGKRSLTRELDFDGRSFLHNYNHSEDQDLSILELIMTAPMIVTNWINMQYYASTVCTEKFGAGNKVMNNVVGGIGCVQGGESDLLGGLTEQSVLYKGEYFHEPIRLQVFIEAQTASIETIINKHQMVRELVENNWLKIISIDPESREFRLFHTREWIQVKEDLWN